MNRRKFLVGTTALAVAAVGRGAAAAVQVPSISTNTYPWTTFAKREKQPFVLHSDDCLRLIASTGIEGYEPIISHADEFAGLAARLKAHKLRMPSIYVNSKLHDAAAAQASIEEVLAIAQQAVELGVKTIVTNPAPIRWGGREDKSDKQLAQQAQALDSLGAKLRSLGAELAYHNHDSELRQGAREFHHMLTATNPDHVKFCLDAHWIFRGCGDSQLAVFDVVKNYGTRIVELHLRQSSAGKWNETFTAEGDIDYSKLRDWLQQHQLNPRVVLEQAIEAGSPQTMSAVEAHRLSLKNAQELFAGVTGKF
jgi:inosose dehydratase